MKKFNTLLLILSIFSFLSCSSNKENKNQATNSIVSFKGKFSKEEQPLDQYIISQDSLDGNYYLEFKHLPKYGKNLSKTGILDINSEEKKKKDIVLKSNNDKFISFVVNRKKYNFFYFDSDRKFKDIFKDKSHKKIPKDYLEKDIEKGFLLLEVGNGILLNKLNKL